MSQAIQNEMRKKDAKNDIFNDQIRIDKAAGSRLYSADGDDYIDLSSQSAYQLIGHNIKDLQTILADAISHCQELGNLPYQHPRVVELCKKLTAQLPSQNQWHIQFTQSDAEAIDFSIRKAYDYWHAKNDTQRRIFLTFAHANHGTSTSCINLNASFNNHNPYQDFIVPVEHIPYPDTWHLDQKIELKEDLALKRLTEFLHENHTKCAGFIMEPLLQTHDGMQACRPSFMNQVISILKDYRILVIADERYLAPMRSGRFLASQHLSITPDILVIGNNLTNNIIPLGTVIIDQKIIDQLEPQTHEIAAVNYLACITANRTIDILENRLNESHIRKLQDIHARRLRRLNKQPIVKNIRYLGSIGAFDIICEDRSKQAQLIDWFYENSTESKLLIQHHVKSICISPPLCLTIEDLEQAYDIIESILQNMPLQFIVSSIEND
ncbi:MAG: hypothetical protein CMF43_01340 [Legionellales bacterium]|nr:hypothetical protein [Legionellales bacterium]